MSEAIVSLNNHRHLKQTQDEFVNSVSDTPLANIERLACFIKVNQKSDNRTDMLQCIAAAANIELFAKQLKQDLDAKRIAAILELGGKID